MGLILPAWGSCRRWKATCLREETAQGKAALGAVSPLHGVLKSQTLSEARSEARTGPAGKAAEEDLSDERLVDAARFILVPVDFIVWDVKGCI